MRRAEVVNGGVGSALYEARDPERIADTHARRLVARAAADSAIRRLSACERHDGEVPRDPEAADFPLRFVEWIRACVDPSQDGRYTEWIVRVYANGGIPRAEDFGRVRRALDLFDRGKRRLPPERRDVNRLRSQRELEDLVGEIGESERQKRRRARSEQSAFDDPDTWNWVHRSADHGVVVPRSHAESCAIAAHPRSRWCTAVRDDPGTFREYAEEGPLHIVVVPGDVESADRIRELYQFHPPSGQVMDREDREVSLLSLLRRFEGLRRALARDLRTGTDGTSVLRGLADTGDLPAEALDEVEQEDPFLVAELAGRLYAAFGRRGSLTWREAAESLAEYVEHALLPRVGDDPASRMSLLVAVVGHFVPQPVEVALRRRPWASAAARIAREAAARGSDALRKVAAVLARATGGDVDRAYGVLRDLRRRGSGSAGPGR